MENMYYIGLDVHKKTISYCVKDGSGRFTQKRDSRTRLNLDMVDEDASAAVDGGHGKRPFSLPDLRSSQASCSCLKVRIP